MLTHLIIKNFAIIDALEIAFSEGFTAVTGETGAGKSILVNALNLVLGGRATTELIRSRADEAVVEAIFEPSSAYWQKMKPELARQGIEIEDQLIVRRILARSGRNKVFINGCATRVSALRELMRGLVDISGQHEHYSLMDAANHIRILDGFAGLDDRREAVAEVVGRLRSLSREAEQLQRGERQRLTQIDFLRFQLEEIDAAELDPDEEDGLMTELRQLRHAEQLREVAAGATHQLYEGENSAADVVSGICHELARATGVDPRLSSILELLETARIQLVEVAGELRDYAELIDADPRRLAQIEVRIDRIDRLKRKHGSGVEEILARAVEMREELEHLERAEARIDEALLQEQTLRKVVLAQARTLSHLRKEAGRRLTQLVEGELGVLGMVGCRFEVLIHHLGEGGELLEDVSQAGIAALGPEGIDQIEFAIAPNQGEELRGMARIASGGELSRIMLAIKSGLLMTDPVESYVFDEIDSGIGGRVAEVVGRKIKEVSRNRQVISITHLPQIASFADWHMVVEKRHGQDRTVSTIRQLTEPERVREVARMLGGVTITQKTLDHAEEMITKAASFDPEDDDRAQPLSP